MTQVVTKRKRRMQGLSLLLEDDEESVSLCLRVNDMTLTEEMDVSDGL